MSVLVLSLTGGVAIGKSMGLISIKVIMYDYFSWRRREGFQKRDSTMDQKWPAIYILIF